MKDTSLHKNNWEDLILAELDGGLDDSDRQKLYNRLNEDAQYRYTFVEFVELCSILKNMEVLHENYFDLQSFDLLIKQLSVEESIAPIVEITKKLNETQSPVNLVSPAKSVHKINKFSLWTALVSTAACLIFVLYGYFNSLLNQPVAFFDEQVNAELTTQSSFLYESRKLYPGSYSLKKGFAKIDFNDGGKVVLQAPADFVIESSSQIYLLKGQLTSFIQNSDKPFVVKTLNSDIIDYGTEFGVSIGQMGDVETYVFDGKIKLKSNVGQSQEIVLNVDDGGKVDNFGRISKKNTNPLKYVRLDEFEVKSFAAKGSPYHRWLEQVYVMHRDPSLVAHYTFDKEHLDTDKLMNKAPATLNKLTGFLEGKESKPQWTNGRWPQKAALQFGRKEDQRIRVPVDPALSITGDITIGVWLNLLHAPVDYYGGMKGGNIISCGIGENVNYHLSYSNYYEQYMLIYKRCRTDIGGYHTIGPAINLDCGQWYFLSVTHENDIVRFYVNGQLLSEVQNSLKEAPVLADLLIGDVQGLEKPYYRFHGLIDEVMIFRRALTETQIQELYTAGSP